MKLLVSIWRPSAGQSSFLKPFSVQCDKNLSLFFLRVHFYFYFFLCVHLSWALIECNSLQKKTCIKFPRKQMTIFCKSRCWITGKLVWCLYRLDWFSQHREFCKLIILISKTAGSWVGGWHLQFSIKGNEMFAESGLNILSTIKALCILLAFAWYYLGENVSCQNATWCCQETI